MIETEIDPFNEDVMRIAKEFMGCKEPIKCASNYVSSNLGDAPNAFTSIIRAMGNMGKPYVAYTSNVGGRVLNEVYDHKTGEEHTVNLADGSLNKNVEPTVGYLDPIDSSEQGLFELLLPTAFGIFIGGLTGFSLARR